MTWLWSLDEGQQHRGVLFTVLFLEIEESSWKCFWGHQLFAQHTFDKNEIGTGTGQSLMWQQDEKSEQQSSNQARAHNNNYLQLVQSWFNTMKKKNANQTGKGHSHLITHCSTEQTGLTTYSNQLPVICQSFPKEAGTVPLTRINRWLHTFTPSP